MSADEIKQISGIRLKYSESWEGEIKRNGKNIKYLWNWNKLMKILVIVV